MKTKRNLEDFLSREAVRSSDIISYGAEKKVSICLFSLRISTGKIPKNPTVDLVDIKSQRIVQGLMGPDSVKVF